MWLRLEEPVGKPLALRSWMALEEHSSRSLEAEEVGWRGEYLSQGMQGTLWLWFEVGGQAQMLPLNLKMQGELGQRVAVGSWRRKSQRMKWEEWSSWSQEDEEGWLVPEFLVLEFLLLVADSYCLLNVANL